MSTPLDHIRLHLESAFEIARQWQDEVQNTEGDSDLFRKLSMYLTPNLDHWINGSQAGNVKDLDELFKRRSAEIAKAGKQGNGHEALTLHKK